MQQGEQAEEAQRRHVRGDEVNPTGFADFLFVVFRRHQEKSRQRHDFPAEQEKNAVPGDHQQGHARGQRAVKQTQFATVLRMLGLLPVTQAINVA